MKTVTVTLTEDQLAEVLFALQDRHNALAQSLKNRERHGALIRIEERQADRVREALAAVEETIAATH